MFVIGAIVSLCYVPGLTGAFIATQWPVLSVLLPFALWREGPWTAVHWLGLLFLAYAFVRVWHTPIFNDGVYGLWLLCIMAASFWLGSTLRDLRSLYAGLAIGASASSAVAVSQVFGYSIVPYVTSAPAGLYVNSVAQGIVLALVAVALVSERMWLWIPLLLPGLVLSGSRGAWLALGIGLVSTSFRSVWIFAVVAAVGALLFALPLSASDSHRLFIWNAAVQNLTWFGWGPGSFFSWLIEYGGSATYPEYAHNEALQLAFEYGIGAVVPLGIFAFILTRTAAREWPIIVAFVTAGCYSMPAWVPVASFLAFVAAGRIVSDWSLARVDGNGCRHNFVPRGRSGHRAGLGAVSVVARS